MDSYKDFEFTVAQKNALREVFETPTHVTRCYGSIGWHPNLTAFGKFFISGGPKVKRLWIQHRNGRRYSYAELGRFDVNDKTLTDFIGAIKRHIQMNGSFCILVHNS